jgi:hypothetical protein
MQVTTETIDARSRKLMEEFEEHWAGIKAANPEVTDKFKVLALWQNQKIAGLQEICLELARQIKYLMALVFDEVDQACDDAMSQEAGPVPLGWLDSLAGEGE